VNARDASLEYNAEICTAGGYRSAPARAGSTHLESIRRREEAAGAPSALLTISCGCDAWSVDQAWILWCRRCNYGEWGIIASLRPSQAAPSSIRGYNPDILAQIPSSSSRAIFPIGARLRAIMTPSRIFSRSAPNTLTRSRRVGYESRPALRIPPRRNIGRPSKPTSVGGQRLAKPLARGVSLTHMTRNSGRKVSPLQRSRTPVATYSRSMTGWPPRQKNGSRGLFPGDAAASAKRQPQPLHTRRKTITI